MNTAGIAFVVLVALAVTLGGAAAIFGDKRVIDALVKVLALAAGIALYHWIFG